MKTFLQTKNHIEAVAHLDTQTRVFVSLVASFVALLAVVGYITAVNFMLIAGDQITQGNEYIRDLERESSELRDELVKLDAPAAIEARSRAYGMIDVAGIHYVPSGDAVAVSRQ
jgi:hypothetical protein